MRQMTDIGDVCLVSEGAGRFSYPRFRDEPASAVVRPCSRSATDGLATTVPRLARDAIIVGVIAPPISRFANLCGRQTVQQRNCAQRSGAGVSGQAARASTPPADGDAAESDD